MTQWASLPTPTPPITKGRDYASDASSTSRRTASGSTR